MKLTKTLSKQHNSFVRNNVIQVYNNTVSISLNKF